MWCLLKLLEAFFVAAGWLANAARSCAHPMLALCAFRDEDTVLVGHKRHRRSALPVCLHAAACVAGMHLLCWCMQGSSGGGGGGGVSSRSAQLGTTADTTDTTDNSNTTLTATATNINMTQLVQVGPTECAGATAGATAHGSVRECIGCAVTTAHQSVGAVCCIAHALVEAGASRLCYVASPCAEALPGPFPPNPQRPVLALSASMQSLQLRNK